MYHYTTDALMTDSSQKGKFIYNETWIVGANARMAEYQLLSDNFLS